jgi:pilus assembly protein CpaB
MSPRRIVFILIALIASGATIFLGRAWLIAERNSRLQAQQQPAPVEKPSTMVLVAKGDLHVGQFLRRENLRWQPWPADSIPPSYVVPTQHQLEDYEGAVVRSSLGDGEPITDVRVVRPGDRGFLAAVLKPGYRAVTIPVTPSSSVAGFIFPGDFVDLLATLKVPDESKDKKGGDHHAAETVLPNLKILALDQRLDDQSKEVAVAKTATLEVTPKQAEIIAVVAEIGKLSLTLRSLPEDEAQVASDIGHTGVTYTFDSEATQLIGFPGSAGSTQKVVVVRGAQETQVEFNRSAQ